MKNLNALEQYRQELYGFKGDKTCGCFIIPFESYKLTVVASSEGGWDHVSVSLKNRCPGWKEMCFIKDLFFEEEDCVMQLHPPKSEYVNNHPFCLHLWRPQEDKIPQPPSIMVGIKELNLND